MLQISCGHERFGSFASSYGRAPVPALVLRLYRLAQDVPQVRASLLLLKKNSGTGMEDRTQGRVHIGVPGDCNRGRVNALTPAQLLLVGPSPSNKGQNN